MTSPPTANDVVEKLRRRVDEALKIYENEADADVPSVIEVLVESFDEAAEKLAAITAYRSAQLETVDGTVTSEMIEAGDEANRAAEPDEGWQDETDAYAVIYLAMKALDPENATLRSELGGMREALEVCRSQFAHYEHLHRLKCTVEGHDKARANRKMVEMIDATLKGSNHGRE